PEPPRRAGTGCDVTQRAFHSPEDAPVCSLRIDGTLTGQDKEKVGTKDATSSSAMTILNTRTAFGSRRNWATPTPTAVQNEVTGKPTNRKMPAIRPACSISPVPLPVA